jgi:arylsulfatase A-like enzyme
MTGQYPHNHGVRRNEDSDQLLQESTLQYYLQQNGYLTGIAGKYLNGWKEAEASPPYFDRWATIDDSSYQKVYYDFLANVNGEIRFPRGYSTDFIARKSVRFMRQFDAEDETPWFLYVSPFASHKPFVPETSYRNARTPQWFGNPSVTEGDRSDKPPWVQERNVRLPGSQAVARLQSRTLMSADDLVEALFKAMAQLDEKRDTLAVFISDNGYLWGEHGLASKRFPYTGAIKVPLMVRWPGVVAADAIDERLAANIDVAPTILQTVGIQPDHVIDGRSLLADVTREKLLFEYFGSRLGGDVPAWASLRSLSYQYVEYYEDQGPTTLFTEYYDLLNDPFQLENLLQDGDPTNDPQATVLSIELARTRDCEGESCP